MKIEYCDNIFPSNNQIAKPYYSTCQKILYCLVCCIDLFCCRFVQLLFSLFCLLHSVYKKISSSTALRATIIFLLTNVK